MLRVKQNEIVNYNALDISENIDNLKDYRIIAISQGGTGVNGAILEKNGTRYKILSDSENLFLKMLECGF